MNKNILLITVLFAALTGCKENSKDSLSHPGDIEYQKLSDEFIQAYLAWRPQMAVRLECTAHFKLE